MIFSRVVFMCLTLQAYWPESAVDTLAMVWLAVPLPSCGPSEASSQMLLLCVPLSVAFGSFLSSNVLHVTTEGGKLSTLQVRDRVSPSITLAFPVILTSSTSGKGRKMRVGVIAHARKSY